MFKWFAIFSGFAAGTAFFAGLWKRRHHEFHDEPRHVLGQTGALHVK